MEAEANRSGVNLSGSPSSNSLKRNTRQAGRRTGEFQCTINEYVLKKNRLGGYHFSKAVLPLLQETEKASPQYPPTLIFTSATAAFKGSALFASFSTGKFAMRSLAQSLAREFGPKGVHVATANIDGIIDIERTKEWKFDLPDAKINPASVSSFAPSQRL